MAIVLSDDGTMDTVLRCTECGEEFRFNFDGGLEWNGHDEPTNDNKDGLYDEWVDSCIAEVEAEHDCQHAEGAFDENDD